MNIVVLDDSQTVLLTIQALLEDLGLSEREIHPFKNGHEALDYIESHGADIIFSDIQMPNISGYKFVEKLLKLSDLYVPTLFIISADENYQSIAKMKTVGAKRFIRKPINAHHFNHFVAPEIKKIQERIRKNEGLERIEDNECAVAIHDSDMIVPPVIDLDYELLSERIGIGMKYIPRLVNSFVNEAKTITEALAETIAAKEYAKIAQYAHALKGSAGNMKFDALYEMAKMIELAATAEDESFSYSEYFQAMREGLNDIFQTPLSEP